MSGQIHYADGVKFPATQVPSSDANTLDDYEEGTWTPAFSSAAGSDGSLAYTSGGRYTKIGNMVTLTGFLALSDIGSRTGRVQIIGVPFNCPGGLDFIFATVCQNVTLDGTQIMAEIGGVSQSYICLYHVNSGGVLTLVDCSDCSATSYFSFSGSYFI